MKHVAKASLILGLVLSVLLTLSGCHTVAKEGVWENATYRRDTELGEGERTLTLEVEAMEQTVTFTVHTNAETVGAALLETGLIEGEQGAYGLYVKRVNGIRADYDLDQRYWAFYVNGGYAMEGVDATRIEEGSVYRLAYEK